MGSQYKIRDSEGLYFVTFTVVGWVDLFTRNVYRDILLDSFEFCRKRKGLNIHAYVIMTNHIHAILSAQGGYDLVAIIRDFKKHTAKKLIKAIKDGPESRSQWMLNKFSYEANRTQRGSDYILWQEGYHAEQIETNQFLEQKLKYLHENPVKAGFVSEAEDFLYSSARNYAGEMGMFDVSILE